DQFTGIAFLNYIATLKGVDKKKAKQEIPRLLELVGLGDVGKKKISSYSGGMKQRLGIAQALINDPEIIILDEPTVGLDPITEQALLRVFMKELEGKTLVWITHHLKGIEHADRILFIENGQLELEGSPQELSQSSQRYR
ncbi:ATP-binding cassette domain-containing protein, partial [Klebsiella pneumoniae]|uniref:ATP-binding cassette domain-containing protein n=1 Tax=Klebsiella pneumoniae TaxID=573 RepID=UPI003A85B380